MTEGQAANEPLSGALFMKFLMSCLVWRPLMVILVIYFLYLIMNLAAEYYPEFAFADDLNIASLLFSVPTAMAIVFNSLIGAYLYYKPLLLGTESQSE